MTLGIQRQYGWLSISAILIGLFLIAPYLVGRGTQALLLTLLLLAAMAQAWNLIGGFGGQLSLGHAAFLGTGAYTTGMLILKMGLPVTVTLPLSGIAAAIFALITSAALLRLRGVYFAIATLAVALATQAWMVTWEYAGASKGLNLPISDLPESISLYYLALALTVVVSLTAWWLSWSTFGLRVMAVRDDEDAARALGVHGTRIKITVFAISGFFTGLTGALVALNQISLVPENLFDLKWTVYMVVMTIIGGLGTVAGPLIGAGVVYYLIEKQFENEPDLAALLPGILVIVVVRFAPAGIWGLFGYLARCGWEALAGKESA